MTASTKKLKTLENLIYLLVWIILFLMPIISMWARMALSDDVSFSWTEVLHFWKILTGYLIAFVIHNFFIAPILIYKRNTVRYLVAVTIFFLAFAAYKCTQKPDRLPGPPPGVNSTAITAPPHNKSTGGSFGMGRKPLIDMRDISAFAILIFAIGTNLGSKNYFRTIQERRELEDLEKENITQELAYLRYQINPHFFMNTLNNIHALVDIDPKEAKEAIVELSKMMRYILYEGEIERIPLAKEMEFIKNYVALMRLRYTEKVKITLRATPLPMSPDVIVAPLLLVPIIENAFKHGVSYQTESYIDVNTVLEKDNIRFTCQNSKRKSRPSTDVKEGGVGLANVRKRMALIYGDAAKMNIHDTEDTYTIELIIPIERLKPELS